MLKYHQPIIKKILDIGKPIHAVNKAKFLEDWITILYLKKVNTAKNTNPLYTPTQPKPANKTPNSKSFAIHICDHMYNS